MTKNSEIIHKGVVIDSDTDFVSIEITSETACDECPVKSICTLYDEKTKIVQVGNKGFNILDKGDVVNLIAKRSLGLRSIWVCYVVPFLILLISILLLYATNVSQLGIVIAAPAALALYYFIILLFGDRIKNELTFTVEK